VQGPPDGQLVESLHETAQPPVLQTPCALPIAQLVPSATLAVVGFSLTQELFTHGLVEVGKSVGSDTLTGLPSTQVTFMQSPGV